MDDIKCPLPIDDFAKFCEYQSDLLLRETDLFFQNHKLRLKKYVLPVKLPEWADSFSDVLDKGEEFEPLTSIYRHKHFLKCRILHNYSYIETKWNRSTDVRNKNIPFDLRPLTSEILNQLDIINEDMLDPEFSGLLVTVNSSPYQSTFGEDLDSIFNSSTTTVSSATNGTASGRDEMNGVGNKLLVKTDPFSAFNNQPTTISSSGSGEAEGEPTARSQLVEAVGSREGPEKMSKIIAGALVECLVTNERCIKSIWIHPDLTKHSSRILLQTFLPRLMYEIFKLPSVTTETGVSTYNKFTYCMHNDLDLFPRQCWLLLASNKKMSLPRHYEPSTFEEHPVQLEYGDCHTDEVGYLSSSFSGRRGDNRGATGTVNSGRRRSNYPNNSRGGSSVDGSLTTTSGSNGSSRGGSRGGSSDEGELELDKKELIKLNSLDTDLVQKSSALATTCGSGPASTTIPTTTSVTAINGLDYGGDEKVMQLTETISTTVGSLDLSNSTSPKSGYSPKSSYSTRSNSSPTIATTSNTTITTTTTTANSSGGNGLVKEEVPRDHCEGRALKRSRPTTATKSGTEDNHYQLLNATGSSGGRLEGGRRGGNRDGLRSLFANVGSISSTRGVACTCRREKLKKSVDDQAWLDRLVGCTENYMYLMLPKRVERARLGLLVRDGWRDLVVTSTDFILLNDINNILPEYAREDLVSLRNSNVNYNADVEEWCRLKREDLIDVTSDTEVYMRLPDNSDQ